jgi:hypothetical protein
MPILKHFATGHIRRRVGRQRTQCYNFVTLVVHWQGFELENGNANSANSRRFVEAHLDARFDLNNANLVDCDRNSAESKSGYLLVDDFPPRGAVRFWHRDVWLSLGRKR